MYLIYDVETTDKLDYKRQYDLSVQPHIIQLGALLADENGKTKGQLDILIKPNGWKIKPEAQAIHGISYEDCDKYGIPILSALAALNLFVKHDNITVICHNTDFDTTLVKYECKRIDKPFILEGRKLFCTMKSTTELCQLKGPRGPKWPKLNELYRFLFNEDFESAHDAFSDVRACARCFFELKKRGLVNG